MRLGDTRLLIPTSNFGGDWVPLDAPRIRGNQFDFSFSDYAAWAASSVMGHLMFFLT